MSLEAATDGVQQIDRVIHRIGDRKSRTRKGRTFPDGPDEEQEEGPPEEPDPGHLHQPRPEENGQSRIDLLVIGCSIPTRQILLPGPLDSSVH